MMGRMILAAAAAALTLTAGQAMAQETDTKPLMRDFIGINGHTVQFDPELYAPLCRLVRDYHPLQWDIEENDTSRQRTLPIAQHIGWKAPPGKFRDWSGPVNWHELYASWQKHGFEIDACIQFDNLPVDQWKDPAADAYRYGRAFAEYFGPSGPHKLVSSIEIGNEPAGQKRYSPEAFRVIFENMARGVRDGDPKLTILTCTADVGESDAWSMPLETFKDAGELYDVINIHKYALLQGWPTWERTFPEDPRIDYAGILQRSIDWRNEHAPDKQVWITEFGFDASTKPPPAEGTFKDWKDSTDLQQAQWIVRSFLFFADLDLDRAYLYWANDADTPSFHASSGVTRNFEPKMSYWAMRHLYQSLGDYRLARAVEKTAGEAWVFEFAHEKDPQRLIWVAWSPTGSDREATRKLALPGKVIKAERMPTEGHQDTGVEVKQAADGSAEVLLTESPLYLWIER